MLSYFANFFVSKESEYIRSLRKRRVELENKLSITNTGVGINICFECYFDQSIFERKSCSHILSSIDHRTINTYEKFLSYCYYLHLHRNENDIRSVLADYNKLDFFLTLQEINSPLVLVLLSNNTEKTKRRYINTLLSYGFTKTKEYNMMVHLILYDAIPGNIITFFDNELLPEIKNYILSLVIELYKDQLIC